MKAGTEAERGLWDIVFFPGLTRLWACGFHVTKAHWAWEQLVLPAFPRLENSLTKVPGLNVMCIVCLPHD